MDKHDFLNACGIALQGIGDAGASSYEPMVLRGLLQAASGIGQAMQAEVAARQWQEQEQHGRE